jgi:hypothetical protein
MIGRIAASAMALGASSCGPRAQQQMPPSGKEDSVVADTRSFEQFGIQVPPGLIADAEVGIHDCVFPQAIFADLKKHELEVVRCDAQYLVAVGKDTIGSDFNSGRRRQPLVLAALPDAKYASAYSSGRLIDETDLDPHVRDLVRRRFKVGSDRRNLKVWALVDPSDQLLGEVVIATSAGTICEFKYSGNPLPQSTCFARAKNTILKLSTNSTDFESIVSVIENISSLSWSK